jgi:putative SOS response-associated peptidase YedK
MCYSAMVKQHLKKLGLPFETRIDLSLFEDLYKRRSDGDKLRLPRAMDFNFVNPATSADKAIKSYIDSYRATTLTESEQELFAQKKRLADAQRKLTIKVTKTAEKEIGISERKVEALKRKIERFQSDKESAADSRIYANDYAPVIVAENDERIIKPMRYLLRPMGFDEDFDRKYPGCYNARRDSLQSFWKKQFMRNHGILVVTSFFENVKRHDYEHRKLKTGEEPENMVIEFKPDGFEEMFIPIIWDCWTKKGSPDLYSFALITDEPPKEISEAGHDRCPIFLKATAIEKWLNPGSCSLDEIQALLDDKEKPFYKNQAVA